ncbi:hypothetical protein ABZX69_20520 [Streptomyces sp. NPDC004074]|uniref:hypothetical protein n=1 Tax=Streptomyces sp. NPDC004074 TaxID=3154277 RepID=UPI0033BF76A5
MPSSLSGPFISRRFRPFHRYFSEPTVDAAAAGGFYFSCRPWATGWMHVVAGDRSGTVARHVSYVGADPLGSLATALSELWEGASRSGCVWELEPAGLRWTLYRSGCDVHVSVSEIPDTEEAGAHWTGTYSLKALSESVAEVGTNLFTVLGHNGYWAWWKNPFPLAALNRLRGHLPCADGTLASLPESYPPPRPDQIITAQPR